MDAFLFIPRPCGGSGLFGDLGADFLQRDGIVGAVGGTYATANTFIQGDINEIIR